MTQLVSVVIPAFNALRWLPETLNSVAIQDWEAKEVILIDDGSTDGTAEYIKQEWPHIRLIRSENMGVSHARNLGTASARGDFLQYIDADDLILPGKIKRQMKLLENSAADVVYGNWQRYLWNSREQKFIGGEVVRRRIEEVNPDPAIAFCTSMWCPTAAYLFRRSFLDKVLPWKEWLPVIQDARFAFDCANAGAYWCHDPEIGALYRQHEFGSISTRNRQAFLHDCVANIKDIETLWRSRGDLNRANYEALLSVYSQLARAAYPVDRPMFNELHAKLSQLKNPYIPCSPLSLRWTTRLVGYARAEWLAFQYRRLKSIFLKLHM